jgi:hypothetical protein
MPVDIPRCAPGAEKVYLGDGAYAEFGGFQIKVTTEDGVRVTNTVYFNQSTFAELVHYAKRFAFFDQLARRVNGEVKGEVNGEVRCPSSGAGRFHDDLTTFE